MIWRRQALFAGLLATCLAFPGLLSGQNGDGRNAHWYLGNYGKEILVWDEASEEIVQRIETRYAIPTGLTMSADRTRLYVRGPMAEIYEIIDLERNESIDEFTLTRGRTRTWISGFQPHPSNAWAVLQIQDRTKLVDRYEIADPQLVRFDLSTKQVTDTIPWPDETQREGVGFRFSPDGEVLYIFMEDIVALDTDDWSEVDRWDLSAPPQPGMGAMSLPFGRSPYQEAEGIYTGLFRMTDPVQQRRMMGIATVDMAAQDVDFYPLGPSEGVSFQISPDGTKGYGLRSEIGDYEVWKFDLLGRRVSERIPFAGRPRMALMPSADGSRLFIYNAGSTIDIYDEATFEYLRTFTFDADMTSVTIVADPQ